MTSVEDNQSDACGGDESKPRTGAIRLRRMVLFAGRLTPYKILTIKDVSLYRHHSLQTPICLLLIAIPQGFTHSILFLAIAED